MDRHPILEPRAQQRVHVRVCRSIRAAMLVDRDDTLRLAQRIVSHGFARRRRRSRFRGHIAPRSAEAPRHIEPDLLHNREGVVERGGGPGRVSMLTGDHRIVIHDLLARIKGAVGTSDYE